MKKIIIILIASFITSCSTHETVDKITIDYFSEYDNDLKFHGEQSYIDESLNLGEIAAEIKFYKVEIFIKSKEIFVEGIVRDRHNQSFPYIDVYIGNILNVNELENDSSSYLRANIIINKKLKTDKNGYFTTKFKFQKETFISAYYLGCYGIVYKLGEYIKLGN